MGLFEERSASPMLIAEQKEAFDNRDWIYELKMDGFRCLSYIENGSVDFRNKRNMAMLSKFPELKEIWRNVHGKCILDGEIVVLKDGAPDFYTLQRRTILTDRFKIELEATRNPASYVVFDCLYYEEKELVWDPLIERKKLLPQLINEDPRIAVSRYIEGRGIALYQIADEKELEGVVAKRKESIYYMGKLSKDWIKFKRMTDEDFITTGYIQKGKYIYSLILGKYKGDGQLQYKGHVTAGVTQESVRQLTPTSSAPFHVMPVGNEHAIWVIPDHVCVVEYMPNTKNSLRQPVFKGYRMDVDPNNIIVQ